MFYLAVIQKTTTGDAQALWPKETLDEALSSFHSELAYRGEERLFTSCAILNESGNLVRPSECWARPAGTPEE